MGSSYETVLVAADIEVVCQALEALDQEAVVSVVATQRTAVVPGRGDYDAPELAQGLSSALNAAAVSWEVYDSDVITAVVFAGGEATHRYVSEQAATIEVIEDVDGRFKARIDGVLHPVDTAPIPHGPTGAHPEPFLPFGSDHMDVEKLEWALRGGPHKAGTPWLFAEWQHGLIIEALGLTPHPLTLGFDQACAADIPEARHTGAALPEDDY
ncbi:MAG TPA: hypothetical protein VGX23_09495 [Actinocrinis sp.]|nr:hypothetical protein [Actinocrinis sp.]